MRKLVTAEIMKQLDKIVITDFGIKALQLMENAGRGVFDLISKYEGDLKGKLFTVVCGKGNNGGDGMIVAGLLAEAKAEVAVFVLAKKTEISEDSKKALLKLSKVIKNITFLKKTEEFELAGNEIVIDAIFGTGFKSNPEGIFYDIIKKINESQCKVYSIDIPSCIHGTTGNSEDIAIFADHTATLGYPKIGLYINEGYTHSGIIDIVDIGFPPELDEEILETRMLMDISDAFGGYKKRPLTVDKKDFGKIFNFSGSLSMPGAATLSSIAALRAGTGLLKLGIPMNISASVSTIYPEVMTIPLGYAQPGYTSMNAEKDVLKGYKWCDACLAGPGLSVHPETKKVVKKMIQKFDGKPTVLDADALNILSEMTELFEDFNSNIVLTPHNGEMARLVGTSKELFLLNRLEITMQKAVEWKCYIVLKGTPTIIAYPNGKIILHVNKKPGMAVGGMGDILSGILVSLLGQKVLMEQAINTAVYVHAVAADFAIEKYGEHSLLPTDVLSEIHTAIKYIIELENKKNHGAEK
ncbi:MAG: NAD(P)H-hydrate dehydratase [Candidatus Delongbacteria bacterium]|nr:NAD(P)H-hydrate dehydratase [Candidatus Delongbacteria bacterium]MCG2760478.1 NAD(P)H-hydrate dehydratase [Candidatus Delongbacteria bacterium]